MVKENREAKFGCERHVDTGQRTEGHDLVGFGLGSSRLKPTEVLVQAFLRWGFCTFLPALLYNVVKTLRRSVRGTAMTQITFYQPLNLRLLGRGEGR